MALIQYPECKAEISDKAPACPKCGIPLKTKSECRIEVKLDHAALAFFYNAFKPNVTINDKKYQRPWGTHSFDVPPGDYEVSASYPWLLSPECGKNTVSFTLKSGEAKRVSYCAGLIRYLPGTISVEIIS